MAHCFDPVIVMCALWRIWLIPALYNECLWGSEKQYNRQKPSISLLPPQTLIFAQDSMSIHLLYIIWYYWDTETAIILHARHYAI